MDRELKIPLGVLAEKRKARSKWADDYWIPVAVLPGRSTLKPGAVIVQGETATRYFMGHAEIYCHAVETEAYVHNLESVQPALFVVLRRNENDDAPLPYAVQCVTFSAYEAQNYQNAAEYITERVSIPPAIAVELIQFVNAHHVEQEFTKRKRTEIRPEDHKFGKEPIFLKDRRRQGSGWDT